MYLLYFFAKTAQACMRKKSNFFLSLSPTFYAYFIDQIYPTIYCILLFSLAVSILNNKKPIFPFSWAKCMKYRFLVLCQKSDFYFFDFSSILSRQKFNL
jgi:hypothetical protein